MVEPQEPNPNTLSLQIVAESSSFQSKVADLSTGLPAEIVQVAEQKVKGLAELRGQINEHLRGINEHFEAVKGMVRVNVHNEENLDGLLTRDVSRYNDCLRYDHERLEELFKQDAGHWAVNVEQARKKANDVSLKIAAVVERQRKELELLMNDSMSRFLKPHMTLRKLPMWGD